MRADSVTALDLSFAFNDKPMKTSKPRSPSALDQPTQTLKEIDQEIAKLQERAASIVAAEKDGVIERAVSRPKRNTWLLNENRGLLGNRQQV